MSKEENSTLKVAGETIGAIVFCNALGGATAIGTSPTRDDWFESLEKPSFQPPNWVFRSGVDGALHDDGDIVVDSLAGAG